MWVYYYLGIGVPVMAGVFIWRKDMRSMVMNSIRSMGMYSYYLWVATAVVAVVLWFIWVMVLFLAIRRHLLHRPNVEEIE